MARQTYSLASRCENVRASELRMLRTLFYKIIPSLPAWLYFWANPLAIAVDAEGNIELTYFQIWNALLIALTALPLWALLFVTMRRRNGLAAVHDLISGTRVPLAVSAAANSPAERCGLYDVPWRGADLHFCKSE
jgi:hypothetical protein